MAALDAADTEAEAVDAVRGVLNKVGIGTRRQDGVVNGPYAGYAPTQEEVAILADQLVRFNRGDESVGGTLRDGYDFVVEAGKRLHALTDESEYPISGPGHQLRADFEQVQASFAAYVRDARDNPEASENALALAIASGSGLASGAVAGEAPLMKSGWRLSPIQKFFFVVWSDYHGKKFSHRGSHNDQGGGGGGIATCEDFGLDLVAKFEWEGGEFVFEKPEGNDGVILLSGDTESGSWEVTDPAEEYQVSLLLMKAGTQQYLYLEPEDDGFSGGFDRLEFGETRGISNLQFCHGEGAPSCTTLCEKRYVTDLLITGKSKRCGDDYLSCENSCHDQGGVG